jgi:uncharacterized membrane protein
MFENFKRMATPRNITILMAIIGVFILIMVLKYFNLYEGLESQTPTPAAPTAAAAPAAAPAAPTPAAPAAPTPAAPTAAAPADNKPTVGPSTNGPLIK